MSTQEISSHRYSQAYQARLTQARLIGDHTHEQWCQLKEVSGHICVKCGKPEHSIRGGLVRGRVVPLCLGGDNSIQNIQPLCQSCASAKGPEIINYLQLRAKGLWPVADREPPVPATNLLLKDVGTPGSRLTGQKAGTPGSRPKKYYSILLKKKTEIRDKNSKKPARVTRSETEKRHRSQS